MTYQHKVGATLSLAGTITATAGGVVPDFSGTTIASQIRKFDGTLVDTLEASWLNVAERTLKLYKADTSAWPAGVAEIDIKFTTPTGEVLFTTTQAINLLKRVTNA